MTQCSISPTSLWPPFPASTPHPSVPPTPHTKLPRPKPKSTELTLPPNSTHNVATLRRGKSLPILPALLDYAPFLLTWTLAPLYLALNPSILHHHLLPFILYVGLINAQSVSQIILAHLLRAPFPYQNPLVWPLALGVLDSAGPWMQDRFGFGWQGVVGSEVAGVGPAGFVWACVGLGAGVYGMFVVVTIERICEYLDINCLSIKHPHVEGGDGEKKAR